MPTRAKRCFSFIIVSSALGMIFAGQLIADDGSGAPGLFLRMGVGTRAMSMGGAFVAVANDPSATFWNPAGLYRMRRAQFEFMSMRMPYDRTLNFVSGAVPVRGLLTVGVSWIGFQIGGIEARTGNTAEPDFTFNNSQNAFFLSAGFPINDFIAVGGSAKFITNNLDEDSATGFGFDASVLFRPSARLSLGLVVQDVGTDLRWNSGFTEAVPLTLRAGAAYRVLPGMLLSVDLQKTLRESPEYRFGTELYVARNIPIRIGYNDQQISAGAGLVLPLGRHLLRLNYGYSNDRVVNAGVHRVSVVFALGTRSRQHKAHPKETEVEIVSTEALQSQPAVHEVEVIARLLNVRSGPGRKFRRIAQVRKGDRLTGLQTRGKWWKVKLSDGRTGWVHENYVRSVGRSSTRPY